MLHNDQLVIRGHCDCTCHQDEHHPCECGAPEWFKAGAVPPRQVLRSGKLASRIVPFSKQRAHRHNSSPIISATSGHGLHAPIYRGRP